MGLNNDGGCGDGGGDGGGEGALCLLCHCLWLISEAARRRRSRRREREGGLSHIDKIEASFFPSSTSLSTVINYMGLSGEKKRKEWPYVGMERLLWPLLWM